METLAERFWTKVDRRAGDECWPWTAGTNSGGYGIIWNSTGTSFAHRVSYELAHGAVPGNLPLDHLCRNRACVNPAHLEPVTSRENTLRSPIALAAIHAKKLTCDHGHDITTPDKFYLTARGSRSCRRCQHARTQSYRARLKESA